MKTQFSIRTIAFILAMIFFSNLAQAQYKFFGTGSLNEGFFPTLTLNGHYFSAGYSGDIGTITKVVANSALSTVVWTKQYPGFNGRQYTFTDIRESWSGNLIVTGLLRVPGTLSDFELVVLEVNQNSGDILQSRIYTLPNQPRLLFQRITKVNADPGCPNCSGAYILTCWVPGTCDDDVFAMKIDYGLNVVWARKYDGGCSDDQPQGIIASTNPNNLGGAIIAGHATIGGFKGFLLEVDGCDGSVVANNCYTSGANDVYIFNNLIRDFDGNIVLNGMQHTGGLFQGALARIHGTNYCNILWSKSYSNPNENVFFTGLTQLQKTKGDCYTGYYGDNGAPGPLGAGTEPRIFKFRVATGAAYYSRDLGGPYPSHVYNTHLPLTVNGSSKVVASTNRPNGGTYDGYLAVMTPTLSDACGTTTSVTFPNLPLTCTACEFTSDSVPVNTYSHCVSQNLVYSVTDACGVSLKPSENHSSNPVDGGAIADPLHNFNPLEDLKCLPKPVAPSVKSAERAAAPAAQNLRFEMYPNPASESVEIVFSDAEQTAGQPLQIVDLNGKVLKTRLLDGEVSELLLDVSDLPKGIYLIKIGNAAVQKLTKM